MAKKKTGRQFLESSDERLISEVFERGIKTVRRSCKNSNAAKIYDLEGAILKRRKAATLNYLDRIRNRYGKAFPVSELDRTWARQNCAMGHSVDGLDHLHYFTLAASIWMLDALKRSSKLKDAFRYFTKDAQTLDAVRLPDVFDPCHDDVAIRAMANLIQERDERDNPFQWYISDATAKRKAPVDHSAPPADPALLSDRERFNAVMSMIHPALKNRAEQRFETKLWDFLDRFFHCAGKYADLSLSLQERTNRLLSDCREFHDRIREKEFERRRQPQASAVLAPHNMMPLVKPSPSPFSVDEVKLLLDGISEECLMENDYDKLDRMARQGLTLQDEVDDAEEQLAGIIHTAHMAPLLDREELEEYFEAEIVDCLLGFEIDDPYEICFGYLCLIEDNSDLPWLYNAAMAVLIAAVRKLPWTAHGEKPESLFEESSSDEDDAAGSLRSPDVSEPPVLQGEGLEPRDWIAKKSQLYQLRYSDKLLFYPDEPPVLNRTVNLPQLIYGLTGMVMPRTVSDFDEMAEELIDAGMEPGLAAGMELYLQLALDVQYPSKDWEAFLQSSRFQQLSRLYGTDSSDLPEGDPVDMDALQKDLKAAKAENDRLKQELYQVQKSASVKWAEAEQALSEAQDERQELIGLRELIYQQANEHEYEEGHTPAFSRIELPYTPQKRVVVFGGHDTWLKAIKPMLPDVVFVNKGQNPNANMIRAAEVVWIQANALSHKNYYKIINIVRQHHIPVRYFGYASARKCALQLAEADLNG